MIDLSGRPVGWMAHWFGVLGGGAAWLAHLMLAYAIAEFGCVGALHEHVVLGMNAVAWLLIAVSVALLLVAGLATLVALRNARRLGASLGGHDHEPHDYMGLVGLVTSGLFALVIAVESVPIFYYLRGC